MENDPETGFDIWSLPLTGDCVAAPLMNSRYGERTPSLSRDSRWMAYDSDGSGRYEVYVQSFPDGDRKQRVSADGGWHAMWREDGKSCTTSLRTEPSWPCPSPPVGRS